MSYTDFRLLNYTFAMPLSDFVKSKVYESAYLFVCKRLPDATAEK